MAARRLAAVLALFALPALAAETAQWPPPAGEEARMRELQQAIIAPDATPAQREAAREELAGMLKSPAGRARGRTPDEKPVHPPRAAIDPFPSVVKPVNIAPAPAAPPPPGGVARVEVVIPPKPVIVPQTGMLKSPAGRARGRTPDEKPVHPPRAAIDPFPSVVKPVNIAPAAPPPPGGVARVEVVIPPKPVIVPQTGSVLVPTDRFAIDPRTGHILHETPGGYVDPLTGRFIPR